MEFGTLKPPGLDGPAPNCSHARAAFLPGFDQRVRHLVIRELGKAVVVVTQGLETRRLTEAHHLIRFLGELGQYVRRRDRDCHDDLAWRPPLEGADRNLHRRPDDRGTSVNP